jgi:ABC-2 type transport system ATP-binding protein
VNNTAIAIKGLNKVYCGKNGKEFFALKNLNLEIPLGSCCALLGPNGAGKSTLINILAGSVIKTSGIINVLDYDLDRDSNLVKRNLGVVPQELFLDVFLSVYEALEIQAGYYGVRSKDRKTDEILTNLDLSEKRNATARSLSGGMKRRLLVGKALVHSPAVLILDEPTAGVDIDLRDKLWKYIRALNEAGTTIILTTHYLQEAEKLCDYFVFINKGSIVSCKKKEDLRLWTGSKEITFRLLKKLSSVPEPLMQYSPKLENEGYSLTILCPIEHLTHAISYIRNQGEVLDIEIPPVDLESIFRNIIGNT